MGKFPIFAEHVAFDNSASFLQIPNKYGKISIKMGKFLKKWESSHFLVEK